MLSPSWIREHADEFDVFHVHFGFDALSPAQLQDVGGRAARGRETAGVHRPRPAQSASRDAAGARRAPRRPRARGGAPDHPDAGRRGRHRAALGAAGRRYCRIRTSSSSTGCGSARPEHERFRDRRAREERAAEHGAGPGADAVAAVARRAARRPHRRRRPSRRLRRGRRSGTTWRCASSCWSTPTPGSVELAVHDCYTDDELWDYFESLDVSVLPYRFGTHSGWLEACFDLGTPVVVPDCGFMAEQRPCVDVPPRVSGSTAIRCGRRSGAYSRDRPHVARDGRRTCGRARCDRRWRTRISIAAVLAMSRPLRIALLASARHPIAEPFEGGLEAHTWTLAHALRERGHDVTLFAGPGSDPVLGVRELPVEVAAAQPGSASRREHDRAGVHGRTSRLPAGHARGGRADGSFDVVHNNSLHYLPVAMAAASRAPVLTTLHTPPTPWLESAAQLNRRHVTFVAVSEHTARAWRRSGRPRAGRPQRHRLSPLAARAGRRPAACGSAGSFRRRVPTSRCSAARSAGPRARPRRADRGRGVLPPPRPAAAGRAAPLCRPPERRRPLVRLVGAASATLVTPRWDEPFGLVVAESLACGTPVAAFARGAVPDLLDDECGVLAAARRRGGPCARRHCGPANFRATPRDAAP